MMRRLRGLIVRAIGSFTGSRRDRDLSDEIESHLQLHIDDNLRGGMSLDEARRAARLRLGGADQVKEQLRDRRGLPFVDRLVQDLRFAMRTFRRTPGFTAVAITTLALGIGANTAIFSVVNAVLLRPLPFPNANRLMLVWATNTESGATEDVASYPDFEDWKAQNHTFEALAAFTERSMTISAGEEAERVPAVQATPGFFETLGVVPAAGRSFRAEEADTAATHVAILSDTAWTRLFGRRPDVLGQTIRAEEDVYTIVGVMPPDFRFAPVEAELIYVPLVRDSNRGHGFLRIIGRLRPGARTATAQADMNVITARIAAAFPRTNKSVGAHVVPLVTGLAGPAQTSLWIFLAVVALVLLIACTNVANLMLVRHASREKELALRTALGAGRARVFSQLMTESALLALAGGAFGLLLAGWGTRLLVALISTSLTVPRIENAQVDAWVLGFTLVLSIGTGILFGVVPALVAASPQVHDSLHEASRTGAGRAGGRRIRATLVVVETALALVLLASAGLLLKGLLVMRGTAPGLVTEQVLAVDFWLPPSKLTSLAERGPFFDRLVQNVTAIPGVQSAALVADLPLGGGQDSLGFQIPGRPVPSPRKFFSAAFNIVSSGYFRTMGIPIRDGREFSGEDSAGSPRVVIINEAAAARFWPGERAVGKQILLPVSKDTTATLTIVGVTGNVRQIGLGAAPKAEFFLDYAQPGPPWPWLVLVARTAGDPMQLAGAIKTAAQTADRNVPIAHMRTLDEIMSRSMAEPRIYTWLLAVFAALALLLAAVGLYGVVSYSVAQRTHELGVRMALGADRGVVVRMVLRQGLLLTLCGGVIGLAAAIASARLVVTLMPSTQPGDPVALVASAVLLLAVAAAASILPARRAARVDPMVALRNE